MTTQPPRQRLQTRSWFFTLQPKCQQLIYNKYVQNVQSRAAGRPAETEQHNKNNPLTVLSSGTKTASLSVTSRPEQLATLMAHHGPAGLLLRRLPLQHFTALSTAIIQQTATRSNRAAAPELQTHGTSVVTLSHSLS